jgi:hypothetical protein
MLFSRDTKTNTSWRVFEEHVLSRVSQRCGWRSTHSWVSTRSRTSNIEHPSARGLTGMNIRIGIGEIKSQVAREGKCAKL